MRHFIVLAAAAALVACDDVPTTPTPGGEVVPFLQLMSETEGRPWECTNYDAATHSCKAISTNEIVGDHWESEGRFYLSDDPQIEFRGRIAFVERDGRACADMTTLQWGLQGGVSPFMEEMLRAQMESELISAGVVCTTYYRANGGYRTVSVSRAGDVMDDGDIVTFHARRPNLRYE